LRGAAQNYAFADRNLLQMIHRASTLLALQLHAARLGDFAGAVPYTPWHWWDTSLSGYGTDVGDG